jgi:hypothetical protein
VGRGQVLGSEGTHLAEAGEHRRGAGRPLADASLDRRMAVRHGDAVASAQTGLDGQVKLKALPFYGLPEAAPALLTGTPTLPVGQREFAADTTLDQPSRAGGAVHLVDGRWPARARASASRPRSLHPRAFSKSTPSPGPTTRSA